MDEQHTEFGEERTIDLVCKNSALSAKNLVENVVTAISHHCGDLPQLDDITLVVIKRIN